MTAQLDATRAGEGEVLWRQDFETAGYRFFANGRHRDGDRFWRGLCQKRIEDKRGTRYFIDLDMWEFDGRRSVSANVQFRTADFSDYEAVNVSRQLWSTISDLEHFFAATWGLLGFGYYEVERHDVDRPSPESEYGQGRT